MNDPASPFAIEMQAVKKSFRRKQFNRDLITHLQGEGRTVFYSSHLLYEVEPVADEVAILHGGRIVRQSDTESLRQQVKQFILPRAAWDTYRKDFQLLDLRAEDDRVAVTVENSPQVGPLLARSGVEHRTVDLNLDEIFEAYVVGRKGESNNSVCLPEAELAAEEA